MKKTSGVIVAVVVLATASGLMARVADKHTTQSRRVPTVLGSQSDRPPSRVEATFVSAQIDTYVLAEFSFDDEFGLCDPQGWVTVDATTQIDTFFHVDDFAGLNGGDYGRLTPLEGQKSLWCGARTEGSPYCNWETPPGYGNQWQQFFESTEFAVVGDAVCSYKIRWDTEPGYDFVYLEYWDEVSSEWSDLPVNGGAGDYDGIGELSESVVIDSAATGGSLKLRFHFYSDSGWSDEDGLWPTDGAVIIDSLTIMDATGTVDYQDFESESVGALATSDGDWSASVNPGFGDYAGLLHGTEVVQEDPCRYNISCFWTFFNGSPDTGFCTPHPEQLVPPYGPDEYAQYLTNEVWSPWIDFTHDIDGNPVPASASKVVLEFDTYRGLPLNGLVFYIWHVRSHVGDCVGYWRDDNFVYYGGQLDWYQRTLSVGSHIEPGASQVQIAIGCWDMCEYWCGVYAEFNCHHHAPLLDNVRLLRVDFGGPVWSVRDIDLFQDNFASDGTVTGTARVDMALDVLSNSNPNILPGDSTVVTVSEPNYGLDYHSTGIPGSGPAVYLHVKDVSPTKSGAAISGDVARWPVASAGGGWTVLRCDTVYDTSGDPVDNQFCADLNDSLYTPGDTIWFYFSARDFVGNTTYWSRFTGASHSEAAVRAAPMEMTCLPANALAGITDILYVDDCDQHGVQPYFDTAYDILGIKPDRYDVRSPAYDLSVGPGGRVSDVSQQIVPYYRKIIWNTGNLHIAPGGGFENEKADDFAMLHQFFEQRTDHVGVYLSGDDVSDYWVYAGGSAADFRNDYMNFGVAWGRHVALGEPVSPLLVAEPGSIFDDPVGGPDSMHVYGGCPTINDFDVLQVTGASVAEINFPNGSGAAVLSQLTPHPQLQDADAHVILSGFSYHYISDDRTGQPMDRVDHLRDILLWMDNAIPEPTGIDQTPKLVNYLDDNYPNPFNPVTTIRYGIEERGHVSLKIYNVAGQLVKTLVDEEQAAPRRDGFKATWDGTNNAGEPVSSGVYFYKLATEGFAHTKKMVLLK
ncbi:MAG: T9SS type A sorting domain-containing protein [Candidatus Latescibacterota bacterium]|nr:MAG: T9SS type A sorting domain-containing protein [Candidatus Latescibacterota bacterium]